MVSDTTILDALAEFIGVENSPVATPGDVAGRLDVGREAVRQRLLRLAADGEVRTRKLGRSRVFWIPAALGAPAAPTSTTREPEPVDELTEDHGRPDRGDVDVDEAVAHLEPPGYDEDVAAERHAALVDAVTALQERGQLTKSGLLAAVDGSGGYDSTESLWKNWLFPALKELESEGAVESPGAAGGWRLTP